MSTIKSLGATPSLLRHAKPTAYRLINASRFSARSNHATRHASSLVLRTTLLPPRSDSSPAPRYFSQTSIANGKAKAKQAARANARIHKEAALAQAAEEEAEDLETSIFSNNNPNHPKNILAAKNASNNNEEHDPRNPKPDPEKPNNFHDVTFVWDRIDQHHAQKIKEIGGRFTESVIGTVPVSLEKNSQHSLRELAVILPAQGRTVQIRMHSPEYKRAIMSAIQASPLFNQQPQPDADDEAVLLLKLEPERPAEQLKKLKALCNEWREQLRRQGAKRAQTHKDWKKSGTVSGDAVKKLEAELSKMQTKRLLGVDSAEKEAGKKINANAI